MRCIVKHKEGRAVAVSFRDGSGWQGRVILDPRVLRLPIGASVEIDEETLRGGTEYGLDFSLIVSDIVITGAQITESLRAHDVWTEDDLVNKTREVQAACLSLAGIVQGRLTGATRRVLGE